MRIMLKGEAAYHTNQWVRERTQMHTIASTLCARRVRWIQTLARNPSHHQLLLATVTGYSKNSQHRSLDERGAPTCHATPCFHQWCHDLQQ
eukprot:9237670-Heterocapsa_arctica.AAC.1